MRTGRGGRVLINTGRPRRNKDWLAGEMDSAIHGIASVVPVCNWMVLPSFLRDHTTDPTAMALRVWASAVPTGATDATSIFSIGIIAWDAATDAEPDPCPGPLSNPERDWMWLWAVPSPGALAFNADSVRMNDGCDTDRQSKAKRRLGNQTSLLIVAQAIGNAEWHYHLHGRVLIAE